MLDGGMPAACADARAQELRERAADDARRTRFALKIYAEARRIEGTAAERYLRAARGIPKGRGWPDDLRFHPHCPRGAERAPAMVALVRDIASDEAKAIHRTFLSADGLSKDPGADGVAKMALGPAKDGAAKLTGDAEVGYGLAIAEGIETALSVRAAGWPVWACLSAGTMATFPLLAGIDCLTIFADHDANGAGEAAARRCEARWAAAGVEVRIVRPKRAGSDWNDVTKGGGL